MGGAVSRTKRLTLDERVQHIRRTPFFLYLDVSTLGEFGKCFPTTGELNLSTTMADPKYRLESKGYLCKKRPGDIISKPKEQRLATEKLTSTKLTVLATMCRYESLDANCTVFEENSPSDKLYIVLNGKSTVLAPQWVGNAT
eukprot:scaffold10584_cov211-Chaetoceros_neogracile.AAC.1